LSLFAFRVYADLAVIDGPRAYDGHLYYMLEASSWTNAEAAASALGGHLVTINDSAENAWVISTFGGDDYALWIGLTDAASERTFVWASGEPLSYGLPLGEPPWALNEPYGESAGYDYVNIHKGSHPTSADLWNDWPNQGIGSVHGIAEVVPVPGSIILLLSGLISLSLVGIVKRAKCSGS